MKTDATHSKNHKNFAFLILILAIFAYVILCFLNIDSSVWFDESYTAFLIRGDFGQIAELTAVDVHPPLFYYCLKIWSMMFGTSAAALRGMSVFFGVVTIILAFLLVRRHFGEKSASATAILLAICPFLIRYGQEMRMYTMAAAIVMGAELALDKALEFFERIKLSSDAKKKKQAGLAWGIYGILVALGMLTHYFTIFAWIANLLFVIFYARENNRKVPWRALILSHGLAILLFLPWLPGVLKQIAQMTGGFWVADVTFATLPSYIANLLLAQDANNMNGWESILVGLVVIFTTILGAEFIQREKNTEKRRVFWQLFSMAVLPVLMLFLASLPPLTSVFVDRYLTYAIVDSWILMAILLTDCDNNNKRLDKIQRLSIIGILLIAGIGIFGVETRAEASDAKELITEIDNDKASDASKGDAGKKVVLAANEWQYLDAVFYNSDETEVCGKWDFEYQWGSYAPIREYNINIAKSEAEFLDKNDEFWYYTTNDDEVSFPEFIKTEENVGDGNKMVKFVRSDKR